MKIKAVRLSVVPSYMGTTSGTIGELNFEIEVFGKPAVHVREMIPDDDFHDLFGFIMQRIERQVREELER